MMSYGDPQPGIMGRGRKRKREERKREGEEREREGTPLDTILKGSLHQMPPAEAREKRKQGEWGWKTGE